MLVAFLVIVPLLLCSPASVYGQTWDLVWSDEFDGAGPNPNPAHWTYDIGGGGWGNNELQFHTDRRENSYVDGGFLYIVAKKEKFRNRKYTSARLKTQGRKQWTYGKMEARIRIPREKGAWPAFWMLGSNFGSVGWPYCGEIDAMEWVWDMADSEFAPTNGDVIRGSAHGPGYSGGNSEHGDWNTALTDGFHNYTVEWEPENIRWYVDSEMYFSINQADVQPWVFDHDFFIILNLAIGGWGGTVDSNVAFPINMTVDYVRVYQDSSQPPPPPPGGFTDVFIDMGTESKGPNWEAVATVRVLSDEQGVPNVSVEGSWSGEINVGVTSGTTDQSGEVELHSGKTRKTGTICFCLQTLDGVPASGFCNGTKKDGTIDDTC